ncbi:MAG: zinc dependent phospholipase C family protein [Clostridiales bacterium]|nr:zinc dependent phospholipase C family protein [Clostridiales bacterium]
MRKKSHILLARFLLKNMNEDSLSEHKKAFYWGSILPDLKPSFLTRRHTIEDTFDILIKEIKRITVNYDVSKGIGKYFARHLGIITHYLADYCTLPHNSIYTGSMADHVFYEKEMKFRLKEYVELEELISMDVTGHKLNSLEDIIEFIEKTHEEYLSALRAVKEDIRYIIEICTKVVQAIIQYFYYSFEELNISKSLQYSRS